MHHDRLVAWLLRKSGELPKADPGQTICPTAWHKSYWLGGKVGIKNSLQYLHHHKTKVCCQENEKKEKTIQIILNNHFKTELHSMSINFNQMWKLTAFETSSTTISSFKKNCVQGNISSFLKLNSHKGRHQILLYRLCQ